MKAISLMQPWATLVALKVKQYETRSWSTTYRGPLLIHASKALPAWARDVCHQNPVRSLLAAGNVFQVNQLPLGAIVAIVDLVDVIPITEDSNPYSIVEMAVGDYTPGRFAWKLDNVRPIGPIEGVKGNLGLWECGGRFLQKGL